MPQHTRRLLTLALAVLMLVSFAGSVSASPLATSSWTSSVTAATSLAEDALDLIDESNQERTARGLVALRYQAEVQAVAQDRAEIMADNDKMSHTEPNGDNVFDRLDDTSLQIYGSGEIIGWNTWPTGSQGVDAVVKAWLASSSHRAIMLSTKYNYVGFGAAVTAAGKNYYAGVYVRIPDETGAWVKTDDLSTKVIDSDRARVYLDWVGSDTKLQILTSGLRHYEIQRRYAGAEWKSWGTTTNTHLWTTWTRGYTYEIRVRARDWDGNWGGWKTITVKL